jgi:TctA family transporter
MQKKMMYLLVPQHVSGIIMPIIRRTVQSRQRLWCTALAVLYTTGVVGFVLFS